MARDWTLLRIGIIFYGLGNQMMSYLYYKARTELTGEKIYLWAPRHKPLADHNGYELDRLFGIKTVGPLLDRIFWQLYLHRDNRLVRSFVSVKRDNLSANLSAPRTGCKLIHFIMAGDKDKDFYTKRRAKIQEIYTFNSAYLNMESRLRILRRHNMVSRDIRRQAISICGLQSWQRFLARHDAH